MSGVRETVLISNRRGLHARASAKFVTLNLFQGPTLHQRYCLRLVGC